MSNEDLGDSYFKLSVYHGIDKICSKKQNYQPDESGDSKQETSFILGNLNLEVTKIFLNFFQHFPKRCEKEFVFKMLPDKRIL